MQLESREFRDLIPGATSAQDLWRRILSFTDAKTVAEVGVWKGDFAKHMLESCKSIQRYYMVDPWATLPNWNKPYNVDQPTFDHIYAQAITTTSFASKKIVVLRGETKQVIASIPDGSLDVAYIDGDHTLRGITIDLIKLLPKMTEDGLIGGDDFVNNPWQHDERYEPTLVCPYAVYFAEAMNLPILGLPFDQFLIQVTSGGSFSFTDYTGAYGDLSLNKLSTRSSAAPTRAPIAPPA